MARSVSYVSHPRHCWAEKAGPHVVSASRLPFSARAAVATQAATPLQSRGCSGCGRVGGDGDGWRHLSRRCQGECVAVYRGQRRFDPLGYPPFKLLLQGRRIFQRDQQLPTLWAAQTTVTVIHQTVDPLTPPTFHKHALRGMSSADGHIYRHGALLSISHCALNKLQLCFSAWSKYRAIIAGLVFGERRARPKMLTEGC